MSDGTPIQPRRGRRREIIDTDIPDWVTMAGFSPTALAIYVILAAHVNQERGDGRAWPTMLTLAQMVGLSRGDKLTRYTKELEDGGAITIHRRKGMPARNIYDVHETPPDGYTGPLTVADWYKAREAKLQVKTVTPSGGEQDETTAVAPSTGQLVTPSTGRHVTPSKGRKQPRTNNPEQKTRKAVDVRDGDLSLSDVAVTNEEREISPTPEPPTPEVTPPVDTLVAEALALHPGWAPRMIRKAIQDELKDGRPLALVAAAWRACIVTPSDGPPSPARFKHAAGPWWDIALRQTGAAPAQAQQGQPPRQRRSCDLCDGRWVLEPDRGNGSRRLPVEPATKCTHTGALVGASS